MAKNLGGRPKIQIDKDEFEKLCELQCTLIEIAGFFRCSEDTIENWCLETYKMRFSDIFRLKRTGGQISLRRSQFRMAESNPTMAIWLGKQYLGQKETIDTNIQANGQLGEILEFMKKGVSTDEDKG